MVAYKIPLQPIPQKFSIKLGVNVYQFTIFWNHLSSLWYMDIADADGNPLLRGRPLVTGVDLLEQFAYIGIPGALLVQSDDDAFALPTFDNLGVTAQLYYIPNGQ